MATAFADLTFAGVKPVAEVAFEKEPAWSATLHTFDGLQVDVAAAKLGDKTYARFSASVDTSAAQAGSAAAGSTTAEAKTAAPAAGEEQTAPPTTGDKKPTATASGKDVQQEAADLNSRWQGWAYALPDYRLAAITKHRADLVKKK